MPIDFDAVRANASLVDTVSRYVELTARGAEYQGLCPFHGERTPSFQIFKGDKGWLYHCKGCGASGDVIDFVAKINGETIGEAAERITGGRLPDVIASPPEPSEPPPEEWVPMLAPADAPFDPARIWNHKKRRFVDHSRAARIDCYRTALGTPICYVARFEHANGSKTIVADTYAAHEDGRREWVTIRPAQPYPLYGQDLLAAREDAPVLVFEGEKKRAIAEPLLTGYVCITILGGTGGAGCTDWTPLHGRSVVLWPDNNEPGRKCMARVAKELAGKVAGLAIVDVSSLPDGHDVADLADAGEDIEDWLGWRMVAYVPTPAPTAKPAVGSKRQTPPKIAAVPDAGPGPQVNPLPAASPAPSAPASNVVPLRKPRPDPVDTELPPEYSDDHLAQRFAEKFSDQCCYCDEMKVWMLWDGSRWKPDRTLAVRDTIRTKICRVAATEAANRLDLKSRGGQIAAALGKANAVSNVDILARADRRIAVTTDQFDADNWVLNTPGGVIDLRTGQMRPARPSDYCTRMTSAAPDGECPTWLWFLTECCQRDQGMVDYLQRWFGYCLTGSVREQTFLFIHGPGGSGKSTVMQVIRHVLGDYAQTTPMETFMKKTRDGGVPIDIAEMKGSRFITAEEITEGRSWDEQKLKLCTGASKLKARFLNRHFFEFDPTFKLTFAGNNAPQLDNVDEAMKRRFVMIPFLNQTPTEKRDKTLEEKLKAESGGILKWMMAGCLEWLQYGLRVPTSVVTATESYFDDQDVIKQFVMSRLDCTDPTQVLLGPVAYQCYARWCDSVGEIPRDMRRFLAALESAGIQRAGRTTANIAGKRVTGVVRLAGVRLKLPGEIDQAGADDWA